MATSTKENQAVIVQEDQDQYFRDKMEECELFERHTDYYDDGLIVDDENKSYSEPDEIAQPKRRRTNSKNETSSSHAIQGNRFSQEQYLIISKISTSYIQLEKIPFAYN